MKKFLVNLVLLFFVISCSSHKAVRQSNLAFDLEAQQNKTTKDGIELMIKPIHLKSELSTYFDEDLLKYGVLPVQVAICNKGDKPVYFSTEGINLIDPSGKRCPLLPVDAVVDKAKKSLWRTAGWTVAFGIFGLIPSAINVSNTNKKIQADYDSRIIKSGNMGSGAVTEGLTFFDVPSNMSSLDGWKFMVAFKDTKNDSLSIVEYGLSGTVEERKDETQQESNSEANSSM